jgi:hypothetical protein
MRRRLLIPLCFLLMAFFTPSHATAAAESTTFKGASAFASFTSTAPDGCLVTYAGITASDERIKESGGKPQTISEVYVTVYLVNICTDPFEVLVDAFGQAQLSAEALQVDKNLNSATLNTTIEACNYLPGVPNCVPIPVAINLTWSGIGPVRNEKSQYQFDDGSCKVHSAYNGSIRDAVATGSMTAPGINFTPEPSVSAQIADVKKGTTYINCP